MSFGVSGKYRLDGRLGGGGMAEVFVGSMIGAEGFSRKVAIKRVLPGYSDHTGFAQMFVAEAQISSQLVHPNIVSVLDFDRDAESRLFLVMELVDGKDLGALIATGLLPLPVVIFVITEVLRGLGFAHDLPTGSGMRGIVHRDMSPHNVLLSWEGAVKVSDFGIAKARAASEATASVFIKGKPAYMSPEQANGQRLDGRSDLFAVGVMLWEMLVGQRLFVAEDTRATLAAVLFGQIPRPRTARADVPKDLERVTMKLLERDLPLRYATAEEAIADLMNCADAPRLGREALMAVLAERFPDAAPVRQSIARARSLAAPTPQPGALPPYSHHTITGSAGGPIATPSPTRPGLETLMSAPTGTLQAQRPPRRLGQLLIVLAAMIVSGVVAFLIVSAVKSRSAAGAPHDQGVGSAAAGAPGSAAPPAASVAGALPGDAAVAIGPGIADASSAAAVTEPPALAAAAPRSGTLSVSQPGLTVTVDGRSYGDTPLTITLAVGTHHVQLRNRENTSNEVLPAVVINENVTTSIGPHRQ
ncbi:MAG TPA: serine/threonine-protein kinase [Kofleriaceae bacterium]|nr:serine/threonine-protein kinase [Kofleriaceae bacterium]